MMFRLFSILNFPRVTILNNNDINQRFIVSNSI